MENPPTPILGWTGKAHGAMDLTDVPPELAAQLPGPQWEYTDRRPDSPTAGLTVYVPAGSAPFLIATAILDKVRQAQEAVV